MLLVLFVTLLFIIASVVLVNLTYRLFSNESIPPNLPWVGMSQSKGPFGRAKANLKSVLGLKGLLHEGYQTYSKNDQVYVLPYFLNGPQVVLPPSQIRWLLEQQDVLSQKYVNKQFLEVDYTFMHANLVDDPVHPEIIKHELTKKLNSFTGDVVDEMEAALADAWGKETEWHNVKVYDTILDVVARLSLRVFVGISLCRDAEFAEACRSFNRRVAISAAVLSLLPAFLKPIFAPIILSYDYMQYRRCSKAMMPMIKERLHQVNFTEKSTFFGSKQPNGYIEWAIKHALAKPVINPRELDPELIACRFAVLAFVAIQSSVITLTSTLFDIAASPDCVALLNTMRNEVQRETIPLSGEDVLPSPPLHWTKSTLARMTHVDSALRESMRLNGFVERGNMKMVVAPEGVTLPDGSHIPHGIKVGVSGYSLHCDEQIYNDAKTYYAFRFAATSCSDTNRTGGKPQAVVNTSEVFMGFSRGSHACPGRFFASNQLKITLAHIVLQYEIEPIVVRPKNKWFFGHIAPPLGNDLRVRRRRNR